VLGFVLSSWHERFPGTITNHYKKFMEISTHITQPLYDMMGEEQERIEARDRGEAKPTTRKKRAKPTKRSPTPAAVKHQKIARLLSEGTHYSTIMREVGVSRTTVWRARERMIRELGVDAVPPRRNKWDEARTLLLELAPSFSRRKDLFAEVAERTGYVHGTVRAIWQSIPLDQRPVFPSRQENIERVAELAKSGLSNEEIAERLGYTFHTVISFIVDARKQGHVISRHRGRRPYNHTTLRILELARAGMRFIDIAAEVGVSPPYVGRVVSRARKRREL
jgi:DNA-binding CsgD family transcriptional regulator